MKPASGDDRRTIDVIALARWSLKAGLLIDLGSEGGWEEKWDDEDRRK